MEEGEQHGIDSRARFCELSDQDLDDIIAEIKRTLPDSAGTGTVLGHLTAIKIHLANGHRRVYESLVRLDALATTRRWNPPITRRTYWVPGMCVTF